MTVWYDFSRPEVIPFVPPTARRILDVGCGAGRFGGELRRHAPLAQLHAIEADSHQAHAAKQHFDSVTVGRFPEVASSFDQRSYDVIVFNDVLEHLADPVEAVLAARSLLADGGCLVASIPNVRHISVVRRLVLNGTWTYTEHGILDRTHLRFFTRSSIADLFASADFDCVVTGINEGLRFARFNRLTRGALEDFTFSQFAAVARPRIS